MGLLKKSKGKLVTIKSLQFTRDTFGVTPSMERMKGHTQRIERAAYSNGNEGVVIQNYIWNVNDLEEVSIKKKDQKLFYFDETLLGDI